MTDNNNNRLLLGLCLIMFWAGQKLIVAFNQLFTAFTAPVNLIFDLFSSVVLLAGIFFTMISILERINRYRRRKSFLPAVDLQKLIGKIIEMPFCDNSEDYVRSIVGVLAENLYPHFLALDCRTRERGGTNMIRSEYTYRLDNYEGIQSSRRAISKYAIRDWEFAQKNIYSITFSFFRDTQTNYIVKLYFDKLNKNDIDLGAKATIKKLVERNLKSIQTIAVKERENAIVRYQNHMFSIAGQNTDLCDYLKEITPSLSALVPYDYISLAVIDNAVENMHRYSFTDTGGALIERGICYPLTKTVTRKAALEKRLMVIGNLGSDFYRDDYHLYKCGYTSRLIYPITDAQDKVLAVATLASVTPGKYRHLTESDLEFIKRPFARMIEFHQTNKMMNTLRKQIGSSFSLAFSLEEKGLMDDFYRETARVLSETLPATMCRIWGYDADSNSLRSLGYHSLHEREDNRSRPIGLELLPHHKRAIQLGKPIIVNQNNPDNQMDESEIDALGIPGMKSAILAPMKLKERVLGVVSVGEIRNWERRSLGPQELLFAQIISTLTALVSALSESRDRSDGLKQKIRTLERNSDLYNVYNDFPNRLSSPISAILGAAQILKNNSGSNQGDLNKFVGIIVRGAESIISELNKFDDIKRSLKKEYV